MEYSELVRVQDVRRHGWGSCRTGQVGIPARHGPARRGASRAAAPGRRSGATGTGDARGRHRPYLGAAPPAALLLKLEILHGRDPLQSPTALSGGGGAVSTGRTAPDGWTHPRRAHAFTRSRVRVWLLIAQEFLCRVPRLCLAYLEDLARCSCFSLLTSLFKLDRVRCKSDPNTDGELTPLLPDVDAVPLLLDLLHSSAPALSRIVSHGSAARGGAARRGGGRGRQLSTAQAKLCPRSGGSHA